MPTTSFPRVPSPPNNPDIRSLAAYVGEVANLFAVMAKELDYLLNGSLDVNNIRAHSITAETLNVDELSAISANLGHITAGLIEAIQIYGSYIATANATYPRVEMSSAGNWLRAYQSASNYTEIAPNILGAPGLHFNDGVTNATILTSAFFGGALGIISSGDIQLSSVGNVDVPDWSQLYSIGDSQSLQSALDSLSSNISSLFSLYASLDARVTALGG